MRTKEDIEYDLKRMDEEDKLSKLMLKKIESYESMINNLNRCSAIFSECAEKISKIKIDLPPPPPPTNPPITDYPLTLDPEKYQALMNKICENLNYEEVIIEGQNLQKKIDKVLKSYEENNKKKGKHKWKK